MIFFDLILLAVVLTALGVAVSILIEYPGLFASLIGLAALIGLLAKL